LAGALSFDEKIRQNAALFWFGYGMMEFFTCKPQPKEQLISLPHGSAQKIAVCAHANREPNKQEY
jgi:hypothetical protein